MKVYHVETQQDYDALMIKLEAWGYTWSDGYFPKSVNKFPYFKEQTAVAIYHDSKLIKHENIDDVRLYTKDKIIEYKARGEKMEKNKNVKYLMFDTTYDVGLLSVKVISENLDEFKTHVLKYILDKESDTGYIEIGLLNPDNSVERLELSQ